MSEHKNSVYRNISLDLMQKIKDGTFPVGSKLPPERHLMEEYKVERMTVRRALDVLAKDGLIVKKSGLGSFVADPDQTADNSVGHSVTSPKAVSEKKSWKALSDYFTFKPDLPKAADMLYIYLKKLGHEKIAFVSSDPAVFSAFAGVFAQNGLFDSEAFLLTDAEIQVENAFERYLRSLRTGFPSAVITASVREAKLAEQALRSLGLNVPEKVTVISVGTDGERYTGCQFDTSSVKRYLETAYSENTASLPSLSVCVPPRLYEGASSAQRQETARERTMSDYLL